MRRWIAVGFLFALVLAACGGGGSSAEKSTSSSDSSSSSESTDSDTESSDTDSSESTDDSSESESLPPGATPGIDDYNDDGAPDPTCGEQDFGGGLVLRILCDLEGRASDPDEGVTLIPDSLFRLPTDSNLDLSEVSASAVYARDAGNKRTFVMIFNTTALFDTGSSEVLATETFDGLVRLINREWPGSTVQVRGHTDSTGSPGSNQTLSEDRAASVAAYLTDHGVNATVTSIGFGQDQPLAIEDGEPGRKFNRRVEVAIHPAD